MEKIKVHILCRIIVFENRDVYEIIWKNTAEQGRPQMAIWRMRIACWIPKATNTPITCNTYSFATAKVAARTQLNVTLYVHCLYCLMLQPVVYYVQ